MRIKEIIANAIGFLRYNLWPLNILQWLILCSMSIGLVAIIGGHYSLHHARNSVNWPSTKGIVAKSYLHEYYSDDDSNEASYDPIVEYNFTVKEKFYTNDRRTYESVGMNKTQAAKVISKYPLDFPVTVYYNPDDPTIAVLEPGAYGTNYDMVIWGYILFIAGLIAFIIVTVKGIE